MNLKTTALSFLAWAQRNSLLRPGAYAPADEFEEPEFDEEFTEKSIAMLRQKQIRYVGINERQKLLFVYLSKAAPSERSLKMFPKRINGFELKFSQGLQETINPVSVAQANNTCHVHQSRPGTNHYTCGSSVSVGNAALAGTLTCLLRHNKTQQMFGLSNNHVTGGCNYAPLGMPIVAPGVLDTSPQNPRPFCIGTHNRQLQMQVGDPSQIDANLNRDAAIFDIVSQAYISSMQQSYYDTPSTTKPINPGMIVEKVGRSSMHTQGIVQSQALGPIDVQYQAAHYNFNGVVYFDPLFIVHGIGDRFSESGDSGALVTTIDDSGVRHAVGIIIAGGTDHNVPGQKISLVAPIEPILSEFDVSLVSSHNV